MALHPSAYGQNPHIPYVSLKLTGDTEDITYPGNHRPQHLMSFQANFLCDEAGYWNADLFDATGHALEEKLKDHYSGSLDLQFGWYKGAKTKVLTAYLMDWSPEFTPGGVIIHINGAFFDWTTLAAVKTTQQHPDKENHPQTNTGQQTTDAGQGADPGSEGLARSVEVTMTISDIVHDLLIYNGFENKDIDITPTSNTLVDVTWSFDSTEAAAKPFTQSESAYSFIRDIASRATTKEEYAGADGIKRHLGGYVFYVDPETKKATFKPACVPTDAVKETFYYFNEDKGLSEIISFAPEVHTGIWVAGGMVRASGTDSVLRTQFNISQDQENNTAFQLGAKRMAMPEPTMKRVRASSSDPNLGNATLLALTNDANSKLADAYLSGIWGALYNFSFYNAKMRVVGRPDLKPLDQVKIFIKPPMAKKLHYASGRFFILGVKHSISASGYITEYDMIKNAAFENAQLPVYGPTPKDDFSGSGSSIGGFFGDNSTILGGTSTHPPTPAPDPVPAPAPMPPPSPASVTPSVVIPTKTETAPALPVLKGGADLPSLLEAVKTKGNFRVGFREALSTGNASIRLTGTEGLPQEYTIFDPPNPTFQAMVTRTTIVVIRQDAKKAKANGLEPFDADGTETEWDFYNEYLQKEF